MLLDLCEEQGSHVIVSVCLSLLSFSFCIFNIVLKTDSLVSSDLRIILKTDGVRFCGKNSSFPNFELYKGQKGFIRALK